MKVFENVFYYRQPIGANCNVYAFKDGADIDLIDTGIDHFRLLEQVWKEMRKDGLDPTHVRNIFHPHYHFDHIQADRSWQEIIAKKKRIKLRSIGSRKDGKDGLWKKIDGIPTVFVTEPDFFRTQPEFNLLQWNYQELRNHFGSIDEMNGQYRGTLFFANFLLYPLVDAKRPFNVEIMKNQTTIPIGNTEARVHITGGHTEGHAFLHFNDENNLLYTGDHDALNEFTCDWNKTLTSVRLAQKLNPDNVFIGHNKVRIGKKSAMGFIDGYFRQFDDIFSSLINHFHAGQELKLTRLIEKMGGWPTNIKGVKLFAHMPLYAICKYMEDMDIGKLEWQSHPKRPEMLFKIHKSPEEIDLLHKIRYG